MLLIKKQSISSGFKRKRMQKGYTMKGRYFHMLDAVVYTTTTDMVDSVGIIQIPEREQIPIHLFPKNKIEDDAVTWGLYGATLSTNEDGMVTSVVVDSRFFKSPKDLRRFMLHQIIGMILYGNSVALTTCYGNARDMNYAINNEDIVDLRKHVSRFKEVTQALQESILYALKTMISIDRETVVIRLKQISNLLPEDDMLRKYADLILRYTDDKLDPTFGVSENSIYGRILKMCHAY